MAMAGKAVGVMSDLTRLTIAEARDALAKKEFSAVELTEAYIAAMEAHRDLNAYIIETPEKAREMAKASDGRIAAGTAGALEGIPLGIKDLFATEGVHTQACSHILDGFKPAYESTVTSNLWRDGAVMLGKLNMDEFAMGSSNETSYYGPVKNPWKAKGDNKDLVPGGSSGGSASAVAAHICAGRNRNRYRRVDPPAGRLYRHRRHQADLWPLLALGHCCIRLIAGSGRTDCP
jgi:aspartyl-tRNA(Asn)/glutamyl-tRNA(Gln) amidotransferase subunit A